MAILFVIGILLGAVTVLFVLQNVTPIVVTFFAWQLSGSLAVVLLASVLAGVVVTLLLLLPEGIQNYFAYRALQKENYGLEEELRKQKELTVFARTPPPTEEALKKLAEE